MQIFLTMDLTKFAIFERRLPVYDMPRFKLNNRADKQNNRLSKNKNSNAVSVACKKIGMSKMQ